MSKKYENKFPIPKGDALRKWINLNNKITMGIASKEEKEEYQMILEAYNSEVLMVNMVCDIQDIQKEGVEIFSESVKTSCCRPEINPVRTSRRGR